MVRERSGGLEPLHVVFDLDGLLVDTEPLWGESGRQLLARRGLQYDASLKPRLMGRHPEEVAAIYIEHYGLDDAADALVDERLTLLRGLYRERGVAVMPGARVLIDALSARGVPMAVASGSPTALIDRVLELAGWAKQLEIRVGSDQVTRGKPAPDVFIRAAELLRAQPCSCVALEDSPAGVDAAVAARMVCVAVPAKTTHPASVASARLVVESLEALSVERLRRLVSEPG